MREREDELQHELRNVKIQAETDRLFTDTFHQQVEEELNRQVAELQAQLGAVNQELAEAKEAQEQMRAEIKANAEKEQAGLAKGKVEDGGKDDTWFFSEGATVHKESPGTIVKVGASPDSDDIEAARMQHEAQRMMDEGRLKDAQFEIDRLRGEASKVPELLREIEQLRTGSGEAPDGSSHP